MKALTIQPARGSQRAIIPAIMAAVSNYVQRTTSNVQRTTLPTAIVSVLVFFACLGLMYVPGIIVSGLTALSCAMSAPMGDDTPIEEGGAA